MARTVLILTALCSVPAAYYATNVIGAGLDTVLARDANNKYAVSSGDSPLVRTAGLLLRWKIMPGSCAQ